MLYDAKLEKELETYRNVSNVHDLPPIFHYWSNKYLRPKLETLGFSDPDSFYIEYILRVASTVRGRDCSILSLGAGNCDTEVHLAARLRERGCSNFRFDCLEVNADMLERGERLATEGRLVDCFDFIHADLNTWAVQTSYDVIIANQSLHHFLELETVFAKCHDALEERGVFLTNDMIGRNGHMRWPEALELVQALWSLLDDKHKWNHQLDRLEATYHNWDCSTQSFEGIRSQDILPLLVGRFGFDLFLGFSNLINVFVDRAFGHNFDIHDPQDLYFIDFTAGLDDHFIEAGRITPTQMLAVMTKDRSTLPRVYKHLTPEFCIRKPTE